MRSAEQDVGRPESIATADKPFATPSLARAFGRDAEESLEDADACASRSVARAAQPDQIAHGFMIGVRHPDGRQLSSPMKTGQHGGVATICLHPITRLHRNQRRRHYVAPMAEACELPINAIAARSGLITKRQRPPGTPALRHRDRAVLCEYPSQPIGYVP